MTTATQPRSFDITQLPSIKAGMTAEEEAMKRRKTCRFIEETGRLLKLPRVSVATAMVFFHRFYAKHSFLEHDRFEVAVACIVLAAKTEESPKKLNTVIDEAYKLKQKGMSAGKGASAAATGFLDPKGEEFAKLKERILLLERVLLHTIGFELSIDHPYKFLVEQIKKMIHNRQLEYITPPTSSSSTSQTMSKMLNELVQYSMNFANDALHCSLCLQFSPHMIATACVYLAGHFAKVKPTHNKSWLEVSGCPDTDADALSSICVQIIELIVDRRGSDNTAFQTIRDDLDKMRGIVGSASPRAVAGSTSPRPPSSQRPPPPPAAAAAAPARPPPPTAGEQPAKRPRTSS